ncbi:MAG TPA: hypothetical protein VG672_07645, partial [Bryobacteraceae bacterium]|nr:hypothetical protein [Bryobacteraceae bacterium]
MSWLADLKTHRPSVQYVAPFLIFLLFLTVDRILPFSHDSLYLMRVVAVSLTFVVFSRNVVSFRTVAFWQSIMVG